MDRTTALIILAAGGSSRLGRPKQQLVYQGTSLLHRAIAAGLASDCQEPLVVVLGAHYSALAQNIPADQVDIVVNPDWKQGLGSSISAGVQALLRVPVPDQAILMLCDQPFVDARLLNRLIATREQTGKSLVACSYNNTRGVPALFDREFFPQLTQLQQNEGAKKIFFKHGDKLALLPFPMGKFDIDTPEDYEALLNIDDPSA